MSKEKLNLKFGVHHIHVLKYKKQKKIPLIILHNIVKISVDLNLLSVEFYYKIFDIGTLFCAFKMNMHSYI